jgi:hypothetical protein
MSYNVPVRNLQDGSVLQVASGGSIQIQSGGSIQIASGGALNISGAAGLSVSALSVGGTLGRFAFGSVGLASGVGTVATGLTRVISAVGGPVLGEASGLGSYTTTIVDLSLSAAGSVIFRAVAGTLPYTGGAATVSWQAWGT